MFTYAAGHFGFPGLDNMANEPPKAHKAVRGKVAAFLGADADEIVSTRGGTAVINLVAGSLGVSMTAGDEVVVTEMEHHSNIVPWHFLRERKGAVIKWVPVADDGSFLFAEFVKLVTARTQVVASPGLQRLDATGKCRLGHVPQLRRTAETAGFRQA